MKPRIFVYIIMILGILNLPAYAHPPKSIEGIYDPETKTLELVIEHPVRDVEKHYIDKIMIFNKGNKLVEQSFSKQFDKDKQKAVYIMPDIEEGDNIGIKAECSVFGSKSISLEIKYKQEK